jgi:hypothetical protein
LRFSSARASIAVDFITRGQVGMTRVRVDGFTVSLDGYGAGPGQTLDDPMGGRERAMLHGWLRGTEDFP